MGAIDNVINVLILGTLVRGLGGPFAFGRGRGIFGDAAVQAAGTKLDGPSKKDVNQQQDLEEEEDNQVQQVLRQVKPLVVSLEIGLRLRNNQK